MDDESTPEQAKVKKHEGLKSVLSTISILIAAPLIALALTSYVFQSYEVEGQSMEATLQDKDRLIVIKSAKTWSRITDRPYIPPRGEIVIFNRVGTFESATSRQKQLIKRVLGLPGERVVVDNGKVTVFNSEHPEGFNPDDNDGYGQTIGYTMGKVDITVPANEIFVCGDNRGNSSDSRSFGTVPVSDLVGTLGLRILPLNKARSF